MLFQSVKGRPGSESILPSGLVAGHAYSITDLREVSIGQLVTHD